MLEQIADLSLNPFLAACCPLGLLGRRASSGQFGLLGSQFLANPRHGSQNRLGQFLENMELADLMGRVAEHIGDRNRIQGRTVGRDAFERKTSCFQRFVETTEELSDVVVGWIVGEDLVGNPLERVVVNDR